MSIPQRSNSLQSVGSAFLSLAALVFGISGLPAQRWHTYTNTNNVTDVIMTQDKVYSATWGGLVEYDLTNNPDSETVPLKYVRTITSVDGLVDNDIRTLAYEESTGDIWAGTFNQGITIIKTNGMQTLDTNSGLPSNKIRRIIVNANYIYIATDQGISQFYYLPEVYFPLLLHQYNSENTFGGLISNDIKDIVVSDNGYLYCATAEGVSFVHTDSLDIDTAWRHWNYANSPLPNAPVLSISVNPDYVAMNTMTSVHRHKANPFENDWHTWTRAAGGLIDSVFTVKLASSGDGIMLSYGVWNEDTMSLKRKSNPLGVIIGNNNADNNLDTYLRNASIYRIIRFPEQYLVYASWGEGTFWQGTTKDYHIEDNCIGFQTISEIITDTNYKMWFGSGWMGPDMTRKGTRGVSSWYNGSWQNYTINNSPLPSNNIRRLAVDKNNCKWFGSWYSVWDTNHWQPGAYKYNDADSTWEWYTMRGIRYYNEETGWSDAQSGTPQLINNTIAEVYVDKVGKILISSSGGGITVFDKNYAFLGTFQMPSNACVYQSVSYIYHSGSRYFFGLNADNRLVIWNDNSLPLNNNEHWLIPPPSELNNCVVYGVVTLNNMFGEEENWIATSRGLFMWNGTDWYKYDTDIKRRIYTNGNWVNETLYYVDEERLFGSVRTTPTAIFLDPFNRIWIGSLEHGFTKYDPETERFTNYYQGNSPLLSNYITCFGYEPLSGNLFIGTPDGLNTMEIGIQINTEKHLRHVKAFPNPFFPEKDGFVRIVNMPSQLMPKGKNICRIFDASGALVIELQENEYARFDWNGLNKNRKKCSSGVYFYVVTSANGETQRGRIALIR